MTINRELNSGNDKSHPRDKISQVGDNKTLLKRDFLFRPSIVKWSIKFDGQPFSLSLSLSLCLSLYLSFEYSWTVGWEANEGGGCEGVPASGHRTSGLSKKKYQWENLHLIILPLLWNKTFPCNITINFPPIWQIWVSSPAGISSLRFVVKLWLFFIELRGGGFKSDPGQQQQQQPFELKYFKFLKSKIKDKFFDGPVAVALVCH